MGFIIVLILAFGAYIGISQVEMQRDVVRAMIAKEQACPTPTTQPRNQ